jgi:hypothetical protein
LRLEEIGGDWRNRGLSLKVGENEGCEILERRGSCGGERKRNVVVEIDMAFFQWRK